MTGTSSTPKLDANERHFRFPGPRNGLLLFLRFPAATRSGAKPVKRDIKIGRGTHLMHLETMRPALWQESIGFLAGNDAAPIP
jgi:hypothetical protein